MTLLTLLKFFCGNRNAILEIAHNRRAIWVGLLFVLSAGLAHGVDRCYLFGDFVRFIQPLAVSLVIVALLFGPVDWATRRIRPENSRWFQQFRTLLVLYWMTTPLDWLFAIPFERLFVLTPLTLASLPFFSITDNVMATTFLLLQIIWIWRTVLIIRVIQVTTGLNLLRATSLVMLLAAILLQHQTNSFGFLPIRYLGFPIPSRYLAQLIGYYLLIPLVLTMVFSPVWLFFSVKSLFRPQLVSASDAPFIRSGKKDSLSMPLQAVACFPLVLGICLLPYTQPQQSLRYQTEWLFRTNRIQPALELMSEHDRDEYPSHWDPFQKRIRYSLPYIQVLLAHEEFAPWVEEIYENKPLFYYEEETTWLKESYQTNPIPLDEYIEAVPSTQASNFTYFLGEYVDKMDQFYPELTDRTAAQEKEFLFYNALLKNRRLQRWDRSSIIVLLLFRQDHNPKLKPLVTPLVLTEFEQIKISQREDDLQKLISRLKLKRPQIIPSHHLN